MNKIKKYIIFLVISLILSSNIVPPITYANEVIRLTSQNQAVQQTVKEVGRVLSHPIRMTEDEMNTLIQQNKHLYPELSEENMREILLKVLSPYGTRATVFDGQGITVQEFSWAINGILFGLLHGIGSLPKLAAEKGIKAAQATLKRAVVAAAKRVGVYAGLMLKIVDGLITIVDIYLNPGAAFAKAFDSRDRIPNNGRINF